MYKCIMLKFTDHVKVLEHVSFNIFCLYKFRYNTYPHPHISNVIQKKIEHVEQLSQIDWHINAV